jgi:hypothetical protein
MKALPRCGRHEAEDALRTTVGTPLLELRHGCGPCGHFSLIEKTIFLGVGFLPNSMNFRTAQFAVCVIIDSVHDVSCLLHAAAEESKDRKTPNGPVPTILPA